MPCFDSYSHDPNDRILEELRDLRTSVQRIENVVANLSEKVNGKKRSRDRELQEEKKQIAKEIEVLQKRLSEISSKKS